MSDKDVWVRAWFEKGEKDLLVAGLALESPDSLYDTACFHAQQCTEKALKGYLIAHGRPAGKTHDLLLLLSSCLEIDPAFSTWTAACKRLNPYAIEPRYPDDFIEYTREDAAEALDLARQVREFVLARIPLPPPTT